MPARRSQTPRKVSAPPLKTRTPIPSKLTVLCSPDAYVAFADLPHGQDLGMVAPNSAQLDLRIAGRDVSLVQSPGLLTSNRSQGTTGAGMQLPRW